MPAFGCSVLRRLSASGRVWLVRDSAGRPAVLKRIPAPHLEGEGRSGSAEAAVLAALNRAGAPGVVRLLDFEAHRGGQLLLLARYEEPGLRLLGTRAGETDAAGGIQRCHAFGALLRTLLVLQRSAVVHGAIRPEHLALDERGAPVLIGFGSCLQLHGHAAPWRDRRARADVLGVARLALSTPMPAAERSWWQSVWSGLLDAASSETWSLEALEGAALTLEQRGTAVSTALPEPAVRTGSAMALESTVAPETTVRSEPTVQPSVTEQLEWAEVPHKPRWLQPAELSTESSAEVFAISGLPPAGLVQEDGTGTRPSAGSAGTALGRAAGPAGPSRRRLAALLHQALEHGFGAAVLQPLRARLRRIWAQAVQRMRRMPPVAGQRRAPHDAEPARGGAASGTPRRRAPRRPRPVLFAAVLFAAISLTALLWPGGEGAEAPVLLQPQVNPPAAGAPLPGTAAPGAAAAEPGRPAPDGGSAAPSGVLLSGDDPLRALRELLTIRQRCFQDQSLLCLEAVLQAASPQSRHDRARLDAPDEALRAVRLSEQSEQAVLIERYGDAALIALGAEGAGAVLLMREDGAWKIRELLPEQAPRGLDGAG